MAATLADSTINRNQVLLHPESSTVRWYGLLDAVGLALALWVTLPSAEQRGVPRDTPGTPDRSSWEGRVPTAGAPTRVPADERAALDKGSRRAHQGTWRGQLTGVGSLTTRSKDRRYGVPAA